MQRNNKDDDENKKISSEDLGFIDDSRKAMLIEVPFAMQFLLYAIGFLVIFFLIWAKFKILDEVTVAHGKVIPSAQIQLVQNLDGGIVSNIYVKEGAIVKKGQILMRLDPTRTESNYGQALAQYWAIVASNARLTAESTYSSTVKYPKKLLEEQPQLAANETSLFNQHKQEINEKLSTLRASYSLANRQLTIDTPLVHSELMSQMQLLQDQSQVNDLRGQIEQTIEEYKTTATEQLVEQQAQLASLEQQLAGLKDQISRTVIKSPVYGIVQNINIATIGGVVTPGMKIMEIVPLGDTLLIEARVLPSDIAFIHLKQIATVKFTAYEYSTYGGLEGKVEYISADTIPNIDNPADKQTYYKILVRTHGNHLGTPEKPLPIMPGMTAIVDIKTGRQSILSYLLHPVLKGKPELVYSAG